MILYDKHNLYTLSVKILFICIRCETDEKNLLLYLFQLNIFYLLKILAQVMTTII